MGSSVLSGLAVTVGTLVAAGFSVTVGIAIATGSSVSGTVSTLDFKPLVIFVAGDSSSFGYVVFQPFTGNICTSGSSMKVTWGDRTVTFSGSNVLGSYFSYVAVGVVD